MQDPFNAQPPQYPPDPPAPPMSSGDAHPSQPNYPPQPAYPPQQAYPPQPYAQQPTYPPPPTSYPPQQPYTPYGTGFQPQPPRKNRTLLWAIIGGVLALLIIVGAVAAAAANANKGPAATPTAQTGNNATTVPTQASQPTAASTQPANSPAGTHKVGDVVTLGGYQVVVNGAKISHGGQFDTPQKAGDVYLEIDVTVTNQTGKAQTFSSDLSFDVKDPSGQKYSSTFVSDAPNSPDGNIQNNDKLRGTLAYEVPPNTNPFKLEFMPDPFNSTDVATWSITAS